MKEEDDEVKREITNLWTWNLYSRNRVYRERELNVILFLFFILSTFTNIPFYLNRLYRIRIVRYLPQRQHPPPSYTKATSASQRSDTGTRICFDNTHLLENTRKLMELWNGQDEGGWGKRRNLNAKHSDICKAQHNITTMIFKREK